LLVTSAWLVGAQTPGPGDKDKKVEPIPAPKVTPAPVYDGGFGGGYGGGYGGGGCNSGCNSCNTCDSGCGHSSFLSRCRGLFSRGSHGCDSCNTCGGGQSWSYGGGSCGCDSGCGHSSFLSRCRGLFSRGGHGGDSCDTCGSGCNGCGSGSGYGGYGAPGNVIVPKGAETIPPPKEDLKKMPNGPTGGTGGKQVQIINPETNTIPTPAPALETTPAAPAIVPARPGEDRPF